MLIAGGAPLPMQEHFPTRELADKYLEDTVRAGLHQYDANDMLYALDSSRDYDPSPKLETIKAAVMHINSADDFINPPELGIAEREIRRVKRGTFVLLPISEQTRGHGTHSLAALWKSYLEQLLNESARKP
jgi:homoserine O-acetyltransferase